MIGELLQAAAQLAEAGIRAEVMKINQLCPLDATPVLKSLQKTRRLVVAEEVIAHGSLGPALVTRSTEAGLSLKGVRLLHLGNGLIPQGTVAEQRNLYGIDSPAIVQAVKELFADE